jgi:hypothetical protein
MSWCEGKPRLVGQNLQLVLHVKVIGGTPGSPKAVARYL